VICLEGERDLLAQCTSILGRFMSSREVNYR
jgi:hypothetical protein